MSHPRPTLLETSAGKRLSEELPYIVSRSIPCTDAQRTPLVKHPVPLAPEQYYDKGWFIDPTNGQRIVPEIFSFRYKINVGGTMAMMKYMFRQTTRNSCGYACTEMVKHDFNPSRGIEWNRVFSIRSSGEFAYEENSRLFPSTEWLEVKYNDDRFPRVCLMNGHFVVVDYVNDDTVYFRDPYTAQVMSTNLQMDMLRGFIYRGEPNAAAAPAAKKRRQPFTDTASEQSEKRHKQDVAQQRPWWHFW